MKVTKLANSAANPNPVISPMPSCINFRTKLTHHPPNSGIKNRPFNSSYTLKQCINRLNCFLNNNLALSKNCAAQIKHFLILQSSQVDVDNENCEVSKKGEETGKSTKRENLYIEGMMQTDIEVFSRGKEFKKRPFRQLTENQNHFQFILKENSIPLIKQIQEYEKQLSQKNSLLQNLKEKVQQLQKKTDYLQATLDSTLIQKLQERNNNRKQISSTEDRLKETQQALLLFTEQLKLRECEILYFWQAQLRLT